MKRIICIDPGIHGAVTVLSGMDNPIIEIFDTPIYDKTLKGKKKKNGKYQTKEDYDKKAMAAIFAPYKDDEVIVCLEFVHAMPQQGSVSNFTFGRGKGIWEGIIAAFGFDCIEVSPTQWKKEWGDTLIAQKTEKIESIDAATYNKMSLRERKAYEKNKKETGKLKAQAKKEAKQAARELAITLYPGLADKFQRAKDDGRAESLLMAERIRRMIQRGEM